MGRFLPLLLVVATAIAMAAVAESSSWVTIPNVERNKHAQSLAEFAVKRHNKQNHASLQFLQVVYAEQLERSTQHYTFKLLILLLERSQTNYYWIEVYQDLSAPGQPPVLNLGFFIALSPSSPSWVQVAGVADDFHVQSLGAFAVKRYDAQNKVSLKFLKVVSAHVLDRGTEHYTYHMIVSIKDVYVVKYFKVEVFQDLSAPGQPPVLNLGYFNAV